MRLSTTVPSAMCGSSATYAWSLMALTPQRWRSPFRRERISRLTATIFASNAPIHRLLAGLDLPTHERSVEAGVTDITIDLSGQPIAA